MSRNTLRQSNPKHVAAGSKGGNATLAKHGVNHFSQMGQTPPRPGSAPRGRPAISFVIGADGLLYNGAEAVKLAQEATSFNPGYSDND